MSLHLPIPSINRTERRLISLAILFILIFALGLSLSPAVRAASDAQASQPASAWLEALRWSHWLGVLIWLGVAILAHILLSRRLPERDPYLLPLALLLSGWGLLSIWRLAPSVGLRQSLWLLVSALVFVLGLRLSRNLDFLHRFKYVWLTGGLLLTALTLFLGTNPLGYGPRLWLGCCGLYFQPSEPLKLLLVVYLAAYLAEQDPYYLSRRSRYLLPLLAPTLIMTGLAMALLVAQRDLGTASIFIFLYVIVVFVATGDWRILVFGGLTILLAGSAGYALFDVVRLRVDAWLNPWLDPSGRSYQIVQSLLAVANGGLFGRGPGLGNPTLVPISHSDFIFAAIAEEHGLLGSVALLAVVAILALRGLRIAIHARDTFQRYLAAGLSAHLAGQSILIIGGNLRLLPLTGVTLPFVSYGGSSLLTSFISIMLLELISTGEEERQPAKLSDTRPYLGLGAFLLAGLGAASLASGWWAIYRGPDLLTRGDNIRRAIAERSVRRGSILDRNSLPLAESQAVSGEYVRQVLYTPLSPVLGYSSPIYGQAGLEAGLDPYLRGLRGLPGLTIWLNHLLYGQPPPGLDVRLSLDLSLQRHADQLLGEHVGAIVLLDARNGDVLAMASHPTYDANTLEADWDRLLADPHTPLVNRASQSRYPPGELAGLLLPLGTDTPGQELPEDLYLPIAGASLPGSMLDLSPLQAAVYAAALTNNGTRQAPALVMAVDTPSAGWVLLPPSQESVSIYPAATAAKTLSELAVEGLPVWQSEGFASNESGGAFTWFVGGTTPAWNGPPLGIAVLLEEQNTGLAEEIGLGLLGEAMLP